MRKNISTKVFGLYRQLYNGTGAEKLGDKFLELAKQVTEQKLDTKQMFNESIADMAYIHNGFIPSDREAWIITTFDCLDAVIRNMGRYPLRVV